MLVRQLKLVHFRNYESLLLTPGKGLNCIIGNNAQGKTNILEAFFLLSFCRSHRTRKDAELIRWGEGQAYAGIEIQSTQGTRNIAIKFRRGEKKRMELDGSLVSAADLLEVFHAILFSPEDLTLVKQGPEYRRRFMDMELCKTRPAYFYHLVQYNTALKQKNALLKQPAEAAPGVMEAYDVQLANFGAQLMQARRAFLEELAGIAAAMHRHLSGGAENLQVEYEPDVPNLAASLEDGILDAIQRSLPLDLRRGFLGAGPHRDDIRITLNGKDLRAFGSQGQQRSAALCLKLSEIEIYRRIVGEEPVLLLDDVLSELDPLRQYLLMDTIQGCQTFLTGTQLPEMKKKHTVFMCDNGKILTA